MKKFKEWLSDYLRYILLLIGALLAFTLITFGVQTWLIVKKAGTPQTAETQEEQTQSYRSKGNAIEILTETAAESQSETASTEKAESESASEKHTEGTNAPAAETVRSTEGTPETVPDVSGSPASQTEAASNPVTSESSAPAQTEPPVSIQTEAQTEPQTQAPTEPVTEAPYQPVYMTLKGACYIRSYADYGDNIIGEYSAGTVVEFLEDVGGWYKVQVDGMIGYMGARFF